DGALTPPKNFAKAGWYADGTRPGDVGPAVIAGHVDSKRGPAVFYKLRELQAGDLIAVTRGGKTVRFRVVSTAWYPKKSFPTAEVYGPTPDRQLRLITCGGVFDHTLRSYKDNLVVYAVAGGSSFRGCHPADYPGSQADGWGLMAVRRMLVAGRYRLHEPVGTGGMGRVWLARDEMLDRDVAVKEFVPPDWMNDDEKDRLRDRTLREARSAARLNHPHVVRIYDVVHADGLPWIVMEYVPSRSLHQVIAEDGPFSPADAARIGLDVLDALTAAHRAGVLHRDIKPHNVLMGIDGRVVLTDFGLATFVDDGSVTGPGLVVGSPQYVSPERARDGASTVESDLWSFGATVYAAVEGRSPYARESAMATLMALATEEPDPPVQAGVLTPVLTGLLQQEPGARLTAAQVDDKLRSIVRTAER